MTVQVPLEFASAFGRQLVVRRGAILASQMGDAAENAHQAYASAAIRTAAHLRNVDLTDEGSYVTVAEVRFEFAAQRELSGLRIAFQTTNADLQILVRNAADTTTGTTYTNVGAGDGTDTISAPGSGYNDCIIRIQARRNAVGAASIDYLRIFEKEHTASTLPG